MDRAEQIKLFFKSEAFGVVGASRRRHKFGNKILRCYQQNNLRALPVNPTEKIIEGSDCISSVSDLPDEVNSISIITPPQVTEKVVELVLEKGVKISGCNRGQKVTRRLRFVRTRESI